MPYELRLTEVLFGTIMVRMSASHQQGVRLTPPQIKFLQREAEKLSISVSDLIRRIIDQYREGKE